MDFPPSRRIYIFLCLSVFYFRNGPSRGPPSAPPPPQRPRRCPEPAGPRALWDPRTDTGGGRGVSQNCLLASPQPKGKEGGNSTRARGVYLFIYYSFYIFLLLRIFDPLTQRPSGTQRPRAEGGGVGPASSPPPNQLNDQEEKTEREAGKHIYLQIDFFQHFFLFLGSINVYRKRG